LIINFLLGTAWAFVLIGAISSYLSVNHVGFIFAIASFVVGMVPGLLMVVLIEYIISGFNKHEEIKQLLEELKNSKHS
jgi:chromate transport protein ChrA